MKILCALLVADLAAVAALLASCASAPVKASAPPGQLPYMSPAPTDPSAGAARPWPPPSWGPYYTGPPVERGPNSARLHVEEGQVLPCGHAVASEEMAGFTNLRAVCTEGHRWEYDARAGLWARGLTETGTARTDASP